MNREEQSPAKARRQRTVLALRSETGLEQNPLLNPELGHRLQKAVSHRREAESQHGRRLERDVTALEVLARLRGLWQLQELAGKPVVAHRHCAIERLLGIGTGMLCSFGNDNAGAPRGLADRCGVVQAEPFHEPGKDISRLMADEAVVAAFLGNDRKVSVGPAVKWTGPAVIGAGTLERDRFSDQPDDIGAVAYLLDRLIGDHAHAENSTMVTPVPP